MMQTGLLDWQIRFQQLDEGGDPLPKLQKMVDWERFRPQLERVRLGRIVFGMGRLDRFLYSVPPTEPGVPVICCAGAVVAAAQTAERAIPIVLFTVFCFMAFLLST